MEKFDIYLIRGLAREKAHWGCFVNLLEKQNFVNTVTCLELPGTGQYRKLSSPLSISENAEFLLSHISQGSKHPKVIVAVSMGGMVAIEMLQKNSKQFIKAFVMNTSFSNLSPIYHRLQINGFKQFFKIAKTKSILEKELEVIKMVSRSPDKWEQVSKEWAMVAEKRPMATKNFFRQLVAAARYRIAEKPPQASIVVLGAKGDQMVHWSCSVKLAEYWNLVSYIHPSAGHDICIDDPNWVIEKINQELQTM